MSNTKVSTSELANLWKIYMVENLLIPYKIPMITTCEDKEIKSVITFALGISEKCVKKISEVYDKIGHPIPKGFSKSEDMVEDAPALFSDNFYLLYIHEMAKLGFRTVPQAIEVTEHSEILNIWYNAFSDYKELYNRTSKLLKERDLFPYSPKLPVPNQVDFINEKNYLAGWWGKQRPLSAEEINRVHSTAHRNDISKTLLLGFSKVVKDKEIKKYLDRGIKNANQIIGDMHQILINENIKPPTMLEGEIMDSNVSPYSDKLILVHVAQMGAGAIGIYGTDLASVFRRDIGAKYTKIIAEALLYGADGMNLLIKRGWIEEPPNNRT